MRANRSFKELKTVKVVYRDTLYHEVRMLITKLFDENPIKLGQLTFFFLLLDFLLGNAVVTMK